MGCCVIYPCPCRPLETVADLIRALGHEPLPGESRPAPRLEGPIFLKGRGLKPEPLCRCGHTAELLCDAPVGAGRTCDLPLCYCCRVAIGEDYDLCPVHAAAWRGSNPPVQQVLFAGPRLVPEKPR